MARWQARNLKLNDVVQIMYRDVKKRMPWIELTYTKTVSRRPGSGILNILLGSPVLCSMGDKNCKYWNAFRVATERRSVIFNEDEFCICSVCLLIIGNHCSHQPCKNIKSSKFENIDSI